MSKNAQQSDPNGKPPINVDTEEISVWGYAMTMIAVFIAMALIALVMGGIVRFFQWVF